MNARASEIAAEVVVWWNKYHESDIGGYDVGKLSKCLVEAVKDREYTDEEQYKVFQVLLSASRMKLIEDEDLKEVNLNRLSEEELSARFTSTINEMPFYIGYSLNCIGEEAPDEWDTDLLVVAADISCFGWEPDEISVMENNCLSINVEADTLREARSESSEKIETEAEKDSVIDVEFVRTCYRAVKKDYETLKEMPESEFTYRSKEEILSYAEKLVETIKGDYEYVVDETGTVEYKDCFGEMAHQQIREAMQRHLKK